MERVVKIKVLDNYRLEVLFSDGVRGVVSLAERLFGPMFEPLQDPSFFSKAQIDEFGAVTWPNGADLAPDALHEQLQKI